MKINKVLQALNERKKLDPSDPGFIKSFKDKVKVAVNTLNTAASEIEDFSSLQKKNDRDKAKNIVNTNIDRIVVLSKNVANITQKEDISKLLDSIGIPHNTTSKGSDYAKTIMNEFGIVNAVNLENFINVLQAHANKKGADIDKFLGATTVPKILSSCKELKPLLENNLWKSVFNIRGGSVGKGELLAALLFKGASLNHAPSVENLSAKGDGVGDSVEDDVKGDLYIATGGSLDIAEIKAGSSTQLAFDLRYANANEAYNGLYNYMLEFAKDKPEILKTLKQQDKDGTDLWLNTVWKHIEHLTEGYRNDFFSKVKYLIVFSGDAAGSVLILTGKNFKKFLNKPGGISFQYPDISSKFANTARRYNVSHVSLKSKGIPQEKFNWLPLVTGKKK